MLSNIRKVSKGPLGYSLRLLVLALSLVLIVAACGGPEALTPSLGTPGAESVAPEPTSPATPDAESVAPAPTTPAIPDMESVVPEPTSPATPEAESVAPTPIQSDRLEEKSVALETTAPATPPATPEAESVAPTPIQSARPEEKSVALAPMPPATRPTESVAPTPTASAMSPTESVAPALVQSATPDAESVVPSPTVPAAPDAENAPSGHTPTYSIHPPAHYGAATPSVEDRIYDSDVIIRASLQSFGTDFLRFRVIEYLKGSGPVDITVHASTFNRNTAWDDREAVLFLSIPENQATSGATGSTGEVAGGNLFSPRPMISLIQFIKVEANFQPAIR